MSATVGELGEAMAAIGFTPVAVVTAVLSLGAIIASGIAIRQTRLYHPKPNLVVEESGIHDNTATGYPRWYFQLWNRGNGEAHDVRVTFLDGDGQRSKVEVIALLEVGKVIQIHKQLTEEANPPDFDERGNYIHDYGPVDTRRMRMLIEWRQAPHMTKLRSLTVKSPEH